MLLSSLYATFSKAVGLSASDKQAVSTHLGGRLDIMVCQDSPSIRFACKSIFQKLKSQGHNVKYEGVAFSSGVYKALEKRLKTGKAPPTDFLLDVGGVGAPAALKIIEWYTKNYPEHSLPTINFASLDTFAGVNAAGLLRKKNKNIITNTIDSGEYSWVNNHLKNKSLKNPAMQTIPSTKTLRALINSRLNTSIPLDVSSDYFEKLLDHIDSFSKSGVISAYEDKEINAFNAIKRLRDYALNLAESLQNGFYGQKKHLALTADETFYGATGFPLKSNIVFSIEEIENAHKAGLKKPILLMRNYDPNMVPLLAEGKIGGLITTSSFMASHLKLLCETYMVPGLFGARLGNQGSLSETFDEEAAPPTPNYFNGNEARIGNHTVQRGQDVLMNVDGDGLCFSPPTSFNADTLDLKSLKENRQLQADLKNLDKIQKIFSAYFSGNSKELPQVRANINSTDSDVLDLTKGVGLFRTEQMVATSQSMLRAYKEILFNSSSSAYEALKDQQSSHYLRLTKKLNDGFPVRVRLFDFVHQEVLDKNEQMQFKALYSKTKIQGGDALDTWPKLYKDQVNALFNSLKEKAYLRAQPLEIMMPSIKTEHDVLRIKKVINDEATALGVDKRQYRFGIMVETLECCENIEKIAPLCDFISFGTNDLTQEHTGLSRSDYKSHTTFSNTHGYDPFKIMMPEIFNLLKETIKYGRDKNPLLQVSVCGEQASDLATAEELFNSGVDNISVSPSLNNLYALPILLSYQKYDLSCKRTKGAKDPLPRAI